MHAIQVFYWPCRRWLSLAGLALALLSIPAGYLARSDQVIVVGITLGAALMLAQVVVTVVRNVRAVRQGKPPTF